jgi:hypothetical protein
LTLLFSRLELRKPWASFEDGHNQIPG